MRRAWNAAKYASTVDLKGSLAKSAKWLELRGNPKHWWHNGGTPPMMPCQHRVCG